MSPRFVQNPRPSLRRWPPPASRGVVSCPPFPSPMMKRAGDMGFRVSGLLRVLASFESPSIAALLPQVGPTPGRRCYGSAPGRPMRRQRERDRSEDDFLRSLNFGGSDVGDGGKGSPANRSSPSSAPHRPMRGDKLEDLLRGGDASGNAQRSGKGHVSPPSGRPTRGEGGDRVDPREKSNLFGEIFGEKVGNSRQGSPEDRPIGRFERGDRSGNPSVRDPRVDGQLEGSLSTGKRSDQPVSSLLQKLKLGQRAEEGKAREQPPFSASDMDSTLPESSTQDADEIFRKMKETGLIPNAVAMLDGLCKDGLVQEAMKLFGLMREKGAIPEIVIYTAVVEGFCKAAKFDDAKRVFRKMQSSGILPNAFSYKVLIEGLLKGKRLEDSVDFSLEMLGAGHSPSVATFTGLVHEFCKEKGVEEAEGVVRRLRERGLALDDRAIREHLDKKGPFSPPVWDAIFGKKVSQKPF